MLFFLLKLFSFCCASYGDPFFFNPLFHPGNEGFIDSGQLAFERSLTDVAGGVHVPTFPFQSTIPQSTGLYSSSLNQHHLGSRPLASSNVPLYRDAGKGVSLSSHFGVTSTTSKSQIPLPLQSTKRRTALTPPIPRQRPLPTPYQSYLKPQWYSEALKASASSLKSSTTGLNSRTTGITSGSRKITQYTAASYSPSLQTGFTPIVNSKKSVFRVLKSPSLSQTKKFPSYHTSSATSLSSKKLPEFQPSSSISQYQKKLPEFQTSSSISQYQKKLPEFQASSSISQYQNKFPEFQGSSFIASSIKKSPDLQTSSSSAVQSSIQIKSPPRTTGSTRFIALTAVPALKLAQARRSKSPQAFGTRITSTGVNDTVIKTSVTSSISTRVETVSEDSLKPSASLNNVRTTQADEPLDLSCEGSKDLGWCDLGARYPKSIVHQLLTLCKDFVERTHVEVPHSFALLSDPYKFNSPADNASYTEAKERGNHDTWSWASYFAKKGSLCDVEQGFVRPEAAKDTSGVWNVIVQTDNVKQRIPIEVCRILNVPGEGGGVRGMSFGIAWIFDSGMVL